MIRCGAIGRAAVWSLTLVGLLAGPAGAQTDAQVAGRLTPEVHACEKSPLNGGTLEQALCYKDEAARQDKILNRTWAQAMSRASHSRKITLRDGERKWIKDRNEDCQSEAAEYINTTAAYMYNVCLADETIRRTIWLEKFR